MRFRGGDRFRVAPWGPVDAFLLARLAAELTELWTESWVQGVWQDGEGRLVVRLRVPGRTAHLVLSPCPESPGMGLVARRPPCPASPPALAAYVRAHAEGGRLAAARCQPFERAVELDLRKGAGGVRVVLEATGRRGNLLAVDPEGRLRASLRWEGPERSPLRPLTPGGLYQPPPALGRVGLDRVLRPELEAWAAAGDALPRRLSGLSPVLSAEVLYRHRHGGLPVWEAFVSLREQYGLPGPLWEYPDCLSAVELTHRGLPRALHRQGEGLDRAGAWLEEGRERTRSDAARRRQERERDAFRDRLERRLARIRADLEGLPDSRALRGVADALAAQLHRVASGARWIEVPDFHEAGRTLHIPLDPALGPGANLDALYRRARRADAARNAFAARLDQTQRALAAGVPPPGDGAWSTPGRGAPGAEPFRRYVSSDGWAIWVGRNGVENDRLLREARAWDLWLHARESPGAHVLLRKPGREARPPDRTLAEAAGLAAQHSRRGGDLSVEVMVVEVSRVKKVKGGGRGRVLVSGERSLRVSPGAGNPRPVSGPGGPGG